MSNTKICSKCKEAKNVGEFNERKKGTGIYRTTCRVCIKKQLQIYKEKNIDRIREKNRLTSRLYYSLNRRKINEARRLSNKAKPKLPRIKYEKHGHATKSRWGGTVSPTYKTWQAMIQRCTNPNFTTYYHYGAKGITVYKHWTKFENFLADMGERPLGTTIDRIDNKKGYAPRNCRWATYKEQGQNQKRNRLITFRGEVHCLSEWARRLGINASTLDTRLKKWPIEKALTYIKG